MERLSLALFQSIVFIGTGAPKYDSCVCEAFVQPGHLAVKTYHDAQIGVGKVRHTPEQIAAKLGEAEVLAAAGKTQSEVCKELGISVMTFHRWRLAHAQRLAMAMSEPHPSAAPTGGGDPASRSRIVELQLENARLRKLVTDLLLKKIRLQEEVGHSAQNPGDELAVLQNLLR
jgi:putative transposase